MADQPNTRRTDFGAWYTPNLIAALMSGVGLVVGSIGPWMSFFEISRGGLDGGNGIFTLALGIAATAALFAVLILGLSGGKPQWMMHLSIAAATCGILSLVVAIYAIFDTSSRAVELVGKTARAEVGWGLWLVLISSVALIAYATFVALQARKKAWRYRKGLL